MTRQPKPAALTPLKVIVAFVAWPALSFALGIPVGRFSETYAGVVLVLSTPVNMPLHFSAYWKHGDGKRLIKSCWILLGHVTLVLGFSVAYFDLSAFEWPTLMFLLTNVALSVTVLLVVDVILRLLPAPED